MNPRLSFNFKILMCGEGEILEYQPRLTIPYLVYKFIVLGNKALTMTRTPWNHLKLTPWCLHLGYNGKNGHFVIQFSCRIEINHFDHRKFEFS